MMGGVTGFLCGVLSGMGIGGGTLLMVWLTAVAGMSSVEAQGINLLYFLPAAAAALPAHRKNGLLEKKVILPAILSGLCAAACTALLVNLLDTRLLRKLFGVFLLNIGLRELFRKEKKTPHPD